MVSAQASDGWREILEAALDRTSGAEAIARLAARGLARLDRLELPNAVRALIEGHPSMAPLWRLSASVLSAPDHAEAARAFEGRLEFEQDRVSARSAHLLASAEGPIVTHSYSGTVIASLVAASAVRPLEIICATSEPGGEGRRTAEQLRRTGIGAALVSDAQAVNEMSRARLFICGADAVTPTSILNKVGTRRLEGGRFIDRGLRAGGILEIRRGRASVGTAPGVGPA